jgi:hypothetical protein
MIVVVVAVMQMMAAKMRRTQERHLIPHQPGDYNIRGQQLDGDQSSAEKLPSHVRILSAHFRNRSVCREIDEHPEA